MENCKTCRFWNFGREHPGFGLSRLLADHCISDCRHHSPVAKDYWAKTRGDDGCGDHKFVPDLTPCWLCGEPIGPPPRHHVFYANEPTCKACAEKEDRKLNQSMKVHYAGQRCSSCGRLWTEDARGWLHFPAPDRVDHVCDVCSNRLKK